MAAAADEFKANGYFGTDSNVIARAAGYAAGTFYKHFDDKRAIFLAVYVEWVSSQWGGIKQLVEGGLPHSEAAEQLIDLILENHRTWRVFRASLRALLATDNVVRRYHRVWRRRQLRLMRELLSDPGDSSDALAMLITERIADALADGEAEAIGLSRTFARQYMVGQLVQTFKQRRRRR